VKALIEVRRRGRIVIKANPLDRHRTGRCGVAQRRPRRRGRAPEQHGFQNRTPVHEFSRNEAENLFRPAAGQMGNLSSRKVICKSLRSPWRLSLRIEVRPDCRRPPGLVAYFCGSVKAMSESPKPNRTYCLPSSSYVTGGFVERPAWVCQSTLPVAGSSATRSPP